MLDILFFKNIIFDVIFLSVTKFGTLTTDAPIKAFSFSTIISGNLIILFNLDFLILLSIFLIVAFVELINLIIDLLLNFQFPN